MCTRVYAYLLLYIYCIELCNTSILFPNISTLSCDVFSFCNNVALSVSGRCILNMDHYCPWMCTCVGYHNYRYFVLFLAYMTLGAFYTVCYTLLDVMSMSAQDR